jgi:hypothetical protein
MGKLARSIRNSSAPCLEKLAERHIIVGSFKDAVATLSTNMWVSDFLAAFSRMNADAEAVKLDHAGFAFYQLELMEQELSDFVHADATTRPRLLSESVRNDLKNDSYGYVGELGDYVQCKLAYVVRQR